MSEVEIGIWLEGDMWHVSVSGLSDERATETERDIEGEINVGELTPTYLSLANFTDCVKLLQKILQPGDFILGWTDDSDGSWGVGTHPTALAGDCNWLFENTKYKVMFEGGYTFYIL